MKIQKFRSIFLKEDFFCFLFFFLSGLLSFLVEGSSLYRGGGLAILVGAFAIPYTILVLATVAFLFKSYIFSSYMLEWAILLLFLAIAYAVDTYFARTRAGHYLRLYLLKRKTMIFLTIIVFALQALLSLQ